MKAVNNQADTVYLRLLRQARTLLRRKLPESPR